MGRTDQIGRTGQMGRIGQVARFEFCQIQNWQLDIFKLTVKLDNFTIPYCFPGNKDDLLEAASTARRAAARTER